MSELRVNTIKHTGGTTGLTIGSGGIISQPTLPIFHVTKSADQGSIVDATDTLVTFDTATDGANSGRVINQGGSWASNKLTVTAETAGYWWVYTNLYWQTSGDAITGEDYAYWRKNGSIKQDHFYTNTQASTNTTGVMFANQVVDLTTAGDYLELFVHFDVQNNGTTNLNQNTVTTARTTAGGWKIA